VPLLSCADTEYLLGRLGPEIVRPAEENSRER
jgi:hypothetical protein